MARIPISNKLPNRAGYMQLDTNTNEVEVFSDGKFKAVTENNEYFNIYKHSKLLFESKTDFYGLPHEVFINPLNLRQYILARKSTMHDIAPAKLVNIQVAWNYNETILLDGTISNVDYRDGFLVYHNNIPYAFVSERSTISPHDYTRFLILNALTGEIIKEDTTLKIQGTSYIEINNEIYFLFGERDGLTHHIVKYSFDTNNFTILNSFNSTIYEAEHALGKINGKFFSISRIHDGNSGIHFNSRIYNSNWTIKETKFLELPTWFNTYTPPYIFRKGSKIMLSFLQRSFSVPYHIVTFEITESNNNLNLILKNMFYPLLKEDQYYGASNDYIAATGYHFPNFLPYLKNGLLLVEDRRITPSYKTRLYQIEYDNDISVDYSNF